MLRPIALYFSLHALYLGLHAQHLGLHALYLAYIIFLLRIYRRNYNEFIVAISIYRYNREF